MEPSERTWMLAHREKLDLLKNVLRVMQSKTIYLVAHNLSGIESCGEEEAALLVRLLEVEDRIKTIFRSVSDRLEVSGDPEKGDPPSDSAAAMADLQARLAEVARQIQRVKARNLTLIENGLQYSQTLLNGIYPPQTYSPRSPAVPASVRPLVSMEC